MQQRRDTSTEEAWPLTPLGAGPGGMATQRDLAKVGQKKEKHNKKEEDDNENIWIN